MTKPRLLVATLGIAGTTFFSTHTAFAMNGPANIEIDGGPLGPLELSGAADGLFYAKSGTNQNVSGDQADAALLNSMMLQLEKTTGRVQFELQIAAYSPDVLGIGYPEQANTRNFTTGALRAANISLVLNSHLRISAGQIDSLEGYESAFPWGNTTGFNTVLYYITNDENRGVSATVTEGPASLSVIYGDGSDTGVFDYLQFSGTYNFNAQDNLNVYGGIALATTGPSAYFYGQSTVGQNEVFANSNLFGIYDTSVIGNLMLTPQVQYQYANADHRYAAAVIPKQTSNFAAALFADYSFGTSPYSLGAWAEYATSHGSAAIDDWFIAPNAELIGFTVAPTWQHKDLYFRVNAGYLHLLNGTAYGNDGAGTNEVIGTLEGGITF